MSKKNEIEGTPHTESKSAQQETPTTQTQAPVSTDLESLIQVRELLTGPLATDVEQRISDTNQRLDRTLQEFTETSAKRMNVMEQGYKDELGKLHEELSDQRGQYDNRVERLERELNLGLEQMRGNIQDVTDQLATTTEGLRDEFAKEFDAIRGTIEDLFGKVTVKLDEANHRLRGELVDRETLSAALSEVAMRLAPSDGETHEVDPEQQALELDQILENATSGQI